MDRELLHRLKMAADYQRKAMRALMPEKMGKHLDVIENEIKCMVMEAAAELLKECGGSEKASESQSSEKSSARKVDIE